MNVIPIVFAFDRNYIMPACVCITSLLHNANPDTFYDIFIMYTSGEPFDEDPRLSFSPYNRFSIHYIPVSSFQNAYEVRGITKLTYYRLLIPELIPQYPKILYSDVDVVFRCDLTQYYQVDMGDSYFAGVNTLFHLFPKYSDYYVNLGLDPKSLIYAGNIVINSRKIMEDGLVEKFIRLSEQNFTYQDMDVINLACKGKIYSMPPSFCLTTFISDIIVNRKDILSGLWNDDEIHDALLGGIVHYNGQKPWIDICPNFDVWWEYYRLSFCYNPVFYYNFFENRIEFLDKLTLWKRIKILARFFIFGRKK